MFYPDGIMFFGYATAIYVSFLALKVGVAPWKLMTYDYRLEKAVKD